MPNDDLLLAHRQELRRGATVLACLTTMRTPEYGYALVGRLADLGLEVEPSTLYPLLRRLERQGLLTSNWNTDEVRPRKFYQTSNAGHEMARALQQEWDVLHRSIHHIQGDPLP